MKLCALETFIYARFLWSFVCSLHVLHVCACPGLCSGQCVVCEPTWQANAERTWCGQVVLKRWTKRAIQNRPVNRGSVVPRHFVLTASYSTTSPWCTAEAAVPAGKRMKRWTSQEKSRIQNLRKSMVQTSPERRTRRRRQLSIPVSEDQQQSYEIEAALEWYPTRPKNCRERERDPTGNPTRAQR